MSLIMPVFAVIIILFGLVRRVPVFDAFLTGAREGAQTLWRIAPTILGLIFAVGLLKSSGAVAVIDRVLAPAANAVGFPPEVVPMALLRPVSGSGSSALLMTVLQDCGPDSFAGRVASVLAGAPAKPRFLPPRCTLAASASKSSVTRCLPPSPPM